MDILLVEDHRLVADAMQSMLSEIDSDANVTACYSTQQALSVIDDGQKFDLVLTDLFMPGIDGMGLLVGLKHRDPSVPVVIITGSDEDQHVRTAMENGASGFITKTLPAADMISGIKVVANGGNCFPDRFVNSNSADQAEYGSQMATSQSEPKLGRKQLNVLQLMADGNSNKQISQIVGITEATVKYHTSQLFKLLDVKNRTSCVREAQQRGLINTFVE